MAGQTTSIAFLMSEIGVSLI